MGSTDDPILVWDLWKNQRKKAPRPPYHRRGQPDLEKAKVRFVPYPNVVRFPKTYFYKSFEIWRSAGVHTLAVWNPLYLLCVAPFSVVQCNFCALHISLLHLLSVASLFDASFGRCIFLLLATFSHEPTFELPPCQVEPALEWEQRHAPNLAVEL